MPRSARKESGVGIYHVMMRGINRQAIFDDDEDCRRFMDILADLPFQHDDDVIQVPDKIANFRGEDDGNLFQDSFWEIVAEKLNELKRINYDRD